MKPTNKNAPRDETHPVCLARGITLSKSEYISGHDFVRIAGEGINAVLERRVCGEVSK